VWGQVLKGISKWMKTNRGLCSETPWIRFQLAMEDAKTTGLTVAGGNKY